MLNGVDLEIKGATKVGVVGRTGAGKSSLVSALFRLNEIERAGIFSGSIKIDGAEISAIGLSRLRAAISIIPQDPVLMAGSFRYNLDPFKTKSDAAVRAALTAAALDPERLDEQVETGGENLSAGERQLLCFARAVLFKRKIMVMDEPTASCDMETDAQLQKMVREEFAGTTIITIAHRLNTIIDYDQLVVLGKGMVLETGPPHVLLANPTGAFSQMVDALGPATAAKLRQRASDAAQP